MPPPQHRLTCERLRRQIADQAKHIAELKDEIRWHEKRALEAPPPSAAPTQISQPPIRPQKPSRAAPRPPAPRHERAAGDVPSTHQPGREKRPAVAAPREERGPGRAAGSDVAAAGKAGSVQALYDAAVREAEQRSRMLPGGGASRSVAPSAAASPSGSPAKAPVERRGGASVPSGRSAQRPAYGTWEEASFEAGDADNDDADKDAPVSTPEALRWSGSGEGRGSAPGLGDVATLSRGGRRLAWREEGTRRDLVGVALGSDGLGDAEGLGAGVGMGNAGVEVGGTHGIGDGWRQAGAVADGGGLGPPWGREGETRGRVEEDGAVVLGGQRREAGGTGGEKRVMHLPGGGRRVEFPNGTRKETWSDGRQVVWFANGDIRKVLPGKGEEYYYAEVDTWHTTTEWGLEVFHFAGGQVEAHRDGGVKEVLFPDGAARVVGRDGVEREVPRATLCSEVHWPRPSKHL